LTWRAAVQRDPLFTAPFLLCFVANFAQEIAWSLFLHFPGFVAGLGATAVEVGWIVSVGSLSSIALRPAIGRMMDQRGRRLVILAGGALNTLVLSLYLSVEVLGPWLVMLRLANGLSSGMLFSAFFTAAADHVPESRRTEGLAIFGVSGVLPFAVGGAVGDRILAGGGYPALFRVAAGFAALSLVFSFFLRDARKLAVGDARQSGSFVRVLLEPRLVPLWWATLVFSLALAAMFSFVKLFIGASGLSSMGAFFGAYAAIAVLLRLFLGWLPDRVGAKRMLYPALALMSGGFLVLSMAAHSWQVVAAGFLCGAGHAYAFPILLALVVTRASDEERGSATSLYTGLFDLGLLLGAPGLGFVVDGFGYPAMFAVATGVVALGGIVFAFWDRTGPKRAEASL
jgi:MFS family permease